MMFRLIDRSGSKRRGPSQRRPTVGALISATVLVGAIVSLSVACGGTSPSARSVTSTESSGPSAGSGVPTERTLWRKLRLDMPLSLAVGPDGSIYVTEWDKGVRKLTPSAGTVARWRIAAPHGGNDVSAEAIAVDRKGNVYVSDVANSRIKKLNPRGALVAVWRSGATEPSESDFDSEFTATPGIAVDNAGYLYFVDQGKSRVRKFDPSGRVVAVWGGRGKAEGRFRGPSGVAVDAQGNVYVVDTGNCRIQKFNGSGHFLSAWGASGEGEGGFMIPNGIAVDAAGHVYVADDDKGSVQAFDGSGRFLAEWWGPQPDLSTPEAVALSHEPVFSPNGVAIGEGQSIYVLEMVSERITKFTTTGELMEIWSASKPTIAAEKTPAIEAVHSQTYSDSTGEQPDAADIDTIVVSNDASGRISFEITIRRRLRLTSDMEIWVAIDADADPSTGAPTRFGWDGTDYLIAIDLYQGHLDAGAYPWDEEGVDVFSGIPVRAFYENGKATITVNAADLGKTRKLDFAVVVASGITYKPISGEQDDSKARYDLAPDQGKDMFRYELTTHE